LPAARISVRARSGSPREQADAITIASRASEKQTANKGVGAAGHQGSNGGKNRTSRLPGTGPVPTGDSWAKAESVEQRYCMPVDQCHGKQAPLFGCEPMRAGDTRCNDRFYGGRASKAIRPPLDEPNDSFGRTAGRSELDSARWHSFFRAFWRASSVAWKRDPGSVAEWRRHTEHG